MEKQAYRHDPENGVYGDCYRTCLAVMLQVPRDSVPHWVTTMDPKEWDSVVQPKYNAWLAERGLQELAIPVGPAELEDVLAFQKSRTPSLVPAMLTGRSRTGCNHCVIVFDGEIFHDPGLDDPGIISSCEDGFYWLAWLIPNSPPMGRRQP
jgi:hypothetical protein